MRPPITSIAFLGTYLPRQSGVASFATDFNDAIGVAFPFLERLVVMSEHGAALLRETYEADAFRIAVIPHGTPVVPPAEQAKERLGVQGHPVLLTFGLLSPTKGIEYVLDAMPQILSRSPDATQVVVGATHPTSGRTNELHRPLCDPSTGGCRDGLHAERVNQNQGAAQLAAAVSPPPQATAP